MAMKIRFGALAYEDPMAEIKKLRQTGTLNEYLQAFDVLLDKVHLGEEQAVSCFLARLRHEVEMMVRIFNPKTLQDAYSLAKLQESVKMGPIAYGQGGMKGVYNKSQSDQSFIPRIGMNYLGGQDGVKKASKIQNLDGGSRRSLTLIPKQIEEKRSKNRWNPQKARMSIWMSFCSYWMRISEKIEVVEKKME